MKRKILPSEKELEILQVLWLHGPETVRFIHEELEKTNPVGYTTTLKTIQRMYDKGYLERRKAGKQHIYSPVAEKKDTEVNLLNNFLDNVFQGSPSKLVMNLLGNKKASQNEIDQIKTLISKFEDNNE